MQSRRQATTAATCKMLTYYRKISESSWSANYTHNTINSSKYIETVCKTVIKSVIPYHLGLYHLVPNSVPAAKTPVAISRSFLWASSQVGRKSLQYTLHDVYNLSNKLPSFTLGLMEIDFQQVYIYIILHQVHYFIDRSGYKMPDSTNMFVDYTM